VKLKKQQRLGDDVHNVSRGAIRSNWVQRFFFVFVFMYRLWKRFWCLERFCHFDYLAICFLKECHSASSLVLASCIIYIVSFSQSKKCLMIYATIIQCIFS
jgi:hypothetical protein